MPLSADNKNAVKNPEKLEIWAYEGTNVYTMYEDGLDEEKNTVLFTEFKSEYTELNGAGTQSLIIFTHGDPTVIPQNREMKICFKNVEDGYVRLCVDGKEEVCKKRLSDCVEVTLSFAAEKTYRIEVIYPVKTRLQRWLKGAQRILTESQGVNYNKEYAWRILLQATTEEEYVQLIDALPVDMATKLRLKETL